ncbi:helix-turn-helix domain-containing protein [Mycobacterium sp. TNTM28]|uniref:Helix-turn-helix domain-containing protein n=1 Tax=[Mycobacterium] fortunisiensis TaxID=2600579 RepID=A0ABS6KMF5_9MYCO|nr:helix-turn-helix domain-containing protein [[Mycobacterium] fortunisiensis]MBU9764746.1 helix-turn-helix domain-containing protein [[Mycobacterium] fortunisiensis]
MEITDSQARLIRDVVAEVMLNRQRLGAPIPERVRDLLRYVSCRGHETDAAATQSDQDPDDLISTEQAAEILGCSPRHARRLTADLDGHRVAGRWTYSRTVVTEYAQGRAS